MVYNAREPTIQRQIYSDGIFFIRRSKRIKELSEVQPSAHPEHRGDALYNKSSNNESVSANDLTVSYTIFKDIGLLVKYASISINVTF